MRRGGGQEGRDIAAQRPVITRGKAACMQFPLTESGQGENTLLNDPLQS